ncbi:MAG: flagellar basal body L-ring protein FlgH [Hydrogenothermaceae bacterium]
MKRLFIISAFILVSCAPKRVDYGKEFNPLPPTVENDIKPVSAGSLYTGYYNNLFSDAKAYTVGDIVTIRVVENLSGQGSANTQTQEQSKMSLSAPSPTLMGKPLINKNPVLGVTEDNSDTYKGSAATNRNARLIATITARVTKVYPNGNLFIVGKKVVRVNDDNQVLLISGIVKPTDITQDNSVDSSRISDMYVEYNGEGYMADSAKPGWLAQFLKMIWPF